MKGKVVHLFVADKRRTDSQGGREQRYRWFCVPLLLVPWEAECEQYQILREVKTELTFSQFIFETRLLAPSIGAQVLGSPLTDVNTRPWIIVWRIYARRRGTL